MTQVADTSIHLRASSEDRELIDEGARSKGMNRSEFMVAASVEAAREELLDRTRIVVNPEAFAEIIDRLESGTLGDDAKIKDLMARPEPWA